jgi:uncharacterized membrane protein HdeD (DUF308 family)
MESERSGETLADDGMPRSLVGWRTAFFLGLITLALGVVVIFRPTQSLNAIAVLLGVAMIISGIYHIARALDETEQDRVWRGIVGVLFILAGLVLIRHLHLSLALIALFIGFTWIIQGIASLMESFARGRRRAELGWSVFFGIVSLIAGIVVISAPITSLKALTLFMGAWFIVMGALEMLGSLAFRSVTRRSTEQVSVPGPRAGTASGTAPGRDAASTVSPPAGQSGS